MTQLQYINIELAKKYSDNIKEYLKEVLFQNNIYNTSETIEQIYCDMLKYIQDGSAIVIGAIEEEKLLGFIWAYKRIVNKERRLHINYFIVNKSNRKQGIGKRLINEIYKYAQKDEIKKIELMVTAQNESAVEFYKNQGFYTERINLCKEI